jgi:hypothetical protein
MTRGPYPGRLDRAEPLARPTPRSLKGDVAMAIDTTTPRSRRALLAGMLGGIAASVAGGLGRAQPVTAHDPDDVRLGADNSTTSATRISNGAANGTAFAGHANGTGWGVSGDSPLGIGVFASSDSGYGVYSLNASVTMPAIVGWSASDNTGLLGYSGQNSPPPGPVKTGVFGSADQDSASRGVHGETPTGTGVHGHSDTHAGVYGSSGSGAPSSIGLKVGVYGWGPVTTGLAPSYGVIGKSASALGTGVLGSCDAGVGVSAASKTGFALYAGGRVQFKTSGLGSIAAGTASAVVTPGVLIGDKTRVLVTLHADPGADTVLKYVSKDTSLGTFNVILTASSAVDCAFSWFLIG